MRLVGCVVGRAAVKPLLARLIGLVAGPSPGVGYLLGDERMGFTILSEQFSSGP